MNSTYSRRRFLTDLLFVGGALVAAAGLAATTADAKDPSPTPRTPSPSKTCPPQDPDSYPLPGDVAPPPPPSPPPKHATEGRMVPVRHRPDSRALGGKVGPSNQKPVRRKP